MRCSRMPLFDGYGMDKPAHGCLQQSTMDHSSGFLLSSHSAALSFQQDLQHHAEERRPRCDALWSEFLAATKELQNEETGAAVQRAGFQLFEMCRVYEAQLEQSGRSLLDKDAELHRLSADNNRLQRENVTQFDQLQELRKLEQTVRAQTAAAEVDKFASAERRRPKQLASVKLETATTFPPLPLAPRGLSFPLSAPGFVGSSARAQASSLPLMPALPSRPSVLGPGFGLPAAHAPYGGSSGSLMAPPPLMDEIITMPALAFVDVGGKQLWLFITSFGEKTDEGVRDVAHGFLVGADEPDVWRVVKNDKTINDGVKTQLMTLWGQRLSALISRERRFNGLQKCLDAARTLHLLPSSCQATSIEWKHVLLLERKQLLRDVFRPNAPDYIYLPLMPEIQTWLANNYIKRHNVEPWFNDDYIRKVANGTADCRAAI